MVDASIVPNDQSALQHAEEQVGGDYLETFETALKQEACIHANHPAASTAGTVRPGRSTPSLLRIKRNRRRFGTGTTNESISCPASPVRQLTQDSVQIDFSYLMLDQQYQNHHQPSPLPSIRTLDAEDRVPPVDGTETTLSGSLLRRTLSTGDLPNHASWQQQHEEDEASAQKQIDTTFCRTNDNSLSPLAVILGNWSTSSSSADNNNNNSPTDDFDGSASMTSSTYFEPDDFDDNWWRESLVNHPPAMGLAVVVMAVVLTHPILFLAGALTAWGSVKAAHQGYHYWNNNDNSSSHSNTTTTDNSSWNEALFCFGNSSVEPQLTSTTIKEGSLLCPQERIETIDPTTEMISEEKKEDPVDDRLSHNKDDNLSKITPSARTRKGTKISIKAWFDRHYPPMQHTVVENGGQLVGINCVEFFRVFFADDAVYDFKEFQRKRHDIDIVYGSWTDVVPDGNDAESANDSISMVPGGSHRPTIADSKDERKCRHFCGRTISFKAKTNSFFGPPYATTVKKQRMLVVDKRLAVLESRTDLSDIPFGDRFFVLERWVVTAAKVDGRYVSHVTASCEAVFYQSGCPFEQQIKTKSVSTIKDIVSSWCTMASEALKLTEQAKLDRMRRMDEDDDDDETVDFESDDASSHKTNNTTSITSLSGLPDQDDSPSHDDDDEHPLITSNSSIEVVARLWNDKADDDDDDKTRDLRHHTFWISPPNPSSPPQAARSSSSLASVRRSMMQRKRRPADGSIM